jgi:hypothetical protein
MGLVISSIALIVVNGDNSFVRVISYIYDFLAPSNVYVNQTFQITFEAFQLEENCCANITTSSSYFCGITTTFKLLYDIPNEFSFKNFYVNGTSETGKLHLINY